MPKQTSAPITSLADTLEIAGRTLTRYAKQRSLAKCDRGDASDLVWYEDRSVTAARTKKWFLVSPDGTIHEHERKAAVERKEFLVPVLVRISARDEQQALERVAKWRECSSVDLGTVLEECERQILGGSPDESADEDAALEDASEATEDEADEVVLAS